jgi:hypothetical protein
MHLSSPRIFWIFRNMINFSRRGVVSTSPNPQDGVPPRVGCPRLLIQNIRSYPPYVQAVPPSATWGRAMPWWQGPTCHCDRDPLVTLKTFRYFSHRALSVTSRKKQHRVQNVWRWLTWSARDRTGNYILASANQSPSPTKVFLIWRSDVLEWSNDPDNYPDGSIATGRFWNAREVKGEDQDKKEYLSPSGLGLVVGLKTPPNPNILLRCQS